MNKLRIDGRTEFDVEPNSRPGLHRLRKKCRLSKAPLKTLGFRHGQNPPKQGWKIVVYRPENAKRGQFEETEAVQPLADRVKPDNPVVRVGALAPPGSEEKR